MHLFNVKRLFLRRRKYDRVLGGVQDEGSLDLVDPPVTHKHHNPQSNKVSGQHYHLSTHAPHQETSSKHATSSATPTSSSWSTLWGFKMRPKLRMHKQKSLKLARTSTIGRQPSQDAVQNFLQGPAEGDEMYNQQCRDLLRHLSARGNRVPGFI